MWTSKASFCVAAYAANVSTISDQPKMAVIEWVVGGLNYGDLQYPDVPNDGTYPFKKIAFIGMTVAPS